MASIPKNLQAAARQVAQASDLLFDEISTKAGSGQKVRELFAGLVALIARSVMGVDSTSDLYDGLTSAAAFQMMSEKGILGPSSYGDDYDDDFGNDETFAADDIVTDEGRPVGLGDSFSEELAREDLRAAKEEYSLQSPEPEAKASPGEADKAEDGDENDEGKNDEGGSGRDYDTPDEEVEAPGWRGYRFNKRDNMQEIKEVFGDEFIRRVNSSEIDLRSKEAFVAALVDVNQLLGRSLDAGEFSAMISRSVKFKKMIRDDFVSGDW